jgi:hypothetical protein
MTGNSEVIHLDQKRPTRAVEELHQIAVTRTERRLYVQVTSPNRTSGQYREFSLAARLLLGNLCYGLLLSPTDCTRTDNTSVITSKAANGYHFKTGQRKVPGT